MITDEMHKAFLSYCIGRGINGPLIFIEIQSEDLGLEAREFPIPAGGASCTIERKVKEECGMVIGGWIVGDNIMGEVDGYKADHLIYNCNLRSGAVSRKCRPTMEERHICSPYQYAFWACGDMLKLVFSVNFPCIRSEVQASKIWPHGLVCISQRDIPCTEAVV